MKKLLSKNALPKPIKEEEFLSQVVELARLFGWAVYHTHDSRRSEPGFPDLLMIRKKQMIVAELKVGTNKPTITQQGWLESFNSCGIETFVWYPSQWDEIERVLA